MQPEQVAAGEFGKSTGQPSSPSSPPAPKFSRPTVNLPARLKKPPPSKSLCSRPAADSSVPKTSWCGSIDPVGRLPMTAKVACRIHHVKSAEVLLEGVNLEHAARLRFDSIENGALVDMAPGPVSSSYISMTFRLRYGSRRRAVW
jgi:hypothetical protein